MGESPFPHQKKSFIPLISEKNIKKIVGVGSILFMVGGCVGVLLPSPIFCFVYFVLYDLRKLRFFLLFIYLIILFYFVGGPIF